MKTIEIKVYQYDELSDKAKENANNYYLNNLFDEWWYESTYDDAKHFHLEIEKFDIYRGYCKAKFIKDAEETAKAIVENAGGELLELARDWQTEVNKLWESFSDYNKYQEWLAQRSYTLDDMEFEDWVMEESGYSDDKESTDSDFLYQLGEYYLKYLRANYDYLGSDEYIADYYECNDYLFDINGKIVEL